MPSTLTRLLFIFSVAVFPSLQQADHISPIRSGCGVSQARLASNVRAPAGPTVVNLIVQDIFTNYNVRMAVGSPARNYTLFLDTGTADLFVGRKYVASNSSMNTSEPAYRDFQEKSFLAGHQFFDTVNLGCHFTVLNQSIGGAWRTRGFGRRDPDGVLGIGPTNLTKNTLTNKRGQSTPTIIDNLFNQKAIPSREVGFSFRPWNKSSQFGEITLGGIDESHFVGPLTYVSITTRSPASEYVGINASISYDNKLLLANGSGIIDIGSTNLQLAPDVYDEYVKAAGLNKKKSKKNGKETENVSFTISKDNYSKLQPLVFFIGNGSFAFTADGQRFPKAWHRHFQLKRNDIYIPINRINKTNNEADFVLGMAWVRRFYHVYDPDNNRVGVANTSYTNVIVNKANSWRRQSLLLILLHIIMFSVLKELV